MSERLCEHCGEPLPEGSRSDRRFCKDGCRQLAYEERQRQERVRLITSEPVDESAVREQQLLAAVAKAIDEPGLVAIIAAEAKRTGEPPRGCWRGVTRRAGESGFHPTG